MLFHFFSMNLLANLPVTLLTNLRNSPELLMKKDTKHYRIVGQFHICLQIKRQVAKDHPFFLS